LTLLDYQRALKLSQDEISDEMAATILQKAFQEKLKVL
jgi:hypothetical protein